MSRRPIKLNVRYKVFERDGFACRYCGQKAPNVVLHVDHIHPVSRGGTDHIDNLCTACSACNSGKSSDPIDPVTQLIAEQRSDALSFWALHAILRHSASEFVADPDAIEAVQDFIGSSADPLALLGIARSAGTWAEVKRLWLQHEGYPDTMWSPSFDEAPE